MQLSSKWYLWWIAFRNVATRNGLGLSFMTTVSIAGVAIGVATLIIVLSVMGGFEKNLQAKMLRGEPHLELYHEQAQIGFSLNDLSLEQVRTLVPEASDTAAFTKADVVLKHHKNLQAAELYGVDPEDSSDLWIFSSTMIEGNLASLKTSHPSLVGEGRWPGIVLGEGLAGNLSVNLGDEVMIINPIAATASSAPGSVDTNVRRYVLTGIFRSSDIKYDNKWAIVSTNEGRRYLAEYDESLSEERFVSGIAMKLSNPFESEEVAKRFLKFEWLRPLTWQKSNQSLLFALKLEKFAMGSVLMLIVVVAAFSISGTIMMTVYHKRTQVAVLRALGMTRMDIVKLYLIHGMLIGTLGIIAGLIFGLGVCYAVYKLPLVNLPQGIYHQSKLPVRFLPETYLVIASCAWIFSLVASVYPASIASQQSPSHGLRYD
jgi:lipoprotein-releasing system permease protein